MKESGYVGNDFKIGESYNILEYSGKIYIGICTRINKNSLWIMNSNEDIEVFYEHIDNARIITKVKGVSKDEPIVTNDQGGKQSKSLYRLDLVPPLALLKVGEELSKGLEHYPPDNWKLISVEDHLNHALIHLYAWIAGDKSDDHLSHATCRLLFATDIEEKNKQ